MTARHRRVGTDRRPVVAVLYLLAEGAAATAFLTHYIGAW